MQLRAAVASDARALARMRYEFRGTRAGVIEGESAFVERCATWMRERLAAESWSCWLAADDDATIVGHIWLQWIEKIPNPAVEPETHAYITNFFVRATQRGSGIGTQLLETALDACRARDIDAVILWPTAESRPLYVRHGFDVPERLIELALSREVT
jgi:GNAT superfamily N-acetyltransferase